MYKTKNKGCSKQKKKKETKTIRRKGKIYLKDTYKKKLQNVCLLHDTMRGRF